jgi:hypothetical protein
LGSQLGEQVECHSGFTYVERPVALFWEGERLEVESVEGQWRTPEGVRFRVCCSNGRYFELFYDEMKDEWRVNPAG